MIIIYPTGTVTQFYGRNALYLNKGFTILPTGPHGVTTRDSYTVPAGRRAVITSMYLHFQRITVAAPIGVYQSAIVLTQSGNSYTLCRIMSVGNVVNDNLSIVNPGQVFLNAGDFVGIETSDASTGGTVGYRAQMAVTEFDP